MNNTVKKILLITFLLVLTTIGYAQDAIVLNIIGIYKMDKADAKAGKWAEFNGTIHITNETIVLYLKSNVTMYIKEVRQQSKYDWDFMVLHPGFGT
jgi:hypothetical protein